MDERLRAYAQLLVGTAIDLAPGQELLIDAEVAHAPLVRALAEQAYSAGARHVDVLYSDRWVHRAMVEAAADEVLGWAPPWQLARLQRAIDSGSAVLKISAESGADLFAGVDEERLARAWSEELDRAWIRGVSERRIAWAIVGYPTERWAAEALGAPDLERFWSAFGHALRLDEPDPSAAWTSRLEALEARAAALTERRFAALRYRGPGTDLEVGLIEGARWLGGRERTRGGRLHAPNLPTEEVYTSPHRLRADGVVTASLPLALHGTLVEDLELRLAGGEIAEVRARRGEAAVRAVLATDAGARRLGEVALVDAGSRVAETGVTFKNGLFDENAASHLAWGTGFPEVLGEPPPADHVARGVNESLTHVDFMVGSDALEIVGMEPGGTAVPLLLGGTWQLLR